MILTKKFPQLMNQKNCVVNFDETLQNRQGQISAFLPTVDMILFI